MVPVADPHREAAAALAAELVARGVRAELDSGEDTLGKRIRTAELEKIPYVLVFGDRGSGRTLAVRRRGVSDVRTAPRSAVLDEIADAARL